MNEYNEEILEEYKDKLVREMEEKGYFISAIYESEHLKSIPEYERYKSEGKLMFEVGHLIWVFSKRVGDRD